MLRASGSNPNQHSKILESSLGSLSSSLLWPYIYLVKGYNYRVSALLWLQPHWALTHTHHTSRQKFLSFTPVCQIYLIPNVLHQNGPSLSMVKRIHINFLQENHGICPEVCGFIICLKNCTPLEHFFIWFSVQS